MKKLSLFSAIAVIALSFTACSDAPKGDQALVADQQQVSTTTGTTTLSIDTAASSIRFTGNGVGKNHPGTFRLSSGDVTLSENQLTGGQFVININSMQVEEQAEIFQTKLKGHLLAPDFFDAAKYGTAKFEITKVEPYTATATDSSVVAGANYKISGNLTLKNVTKNLTFPAKVNVTDSGIEAKANFDIDRTNWDMKYGNDKSLGDKFISETVNIELDLQGKK